jgi:hypothetical protein
MNNNPYHSIEFFPGWNFNSSFFYLHLPNLKDTEKTELTSKIIKYNGKITFTIYKNVIIVVENSNFFKNKDNKELIKDFNTIYFYDNNFVRQINIKNNSKVKSLYNKIIKIITIDALKEELNIFSSKSIDFFFKKGLNKPKNFSEKNLICLLLQNKFKQTENLISYNFNNSKKMEDNDIPSYHPKAPETFSLFCSEYEYIQILNHIKTKEYQKQLLEKKLKDDKAQLLKSEPEPLKKEFLCQICKSRFDNYLEHIKSSLHMKNKSRYNNVFDNIKNTFKRIVENNNNNIKTENNKNNDLIIEENNLFISTKEDSLSINEEINTNKNIICDKKNLEKIVEKNEENEKSPKSDEKKGNDVCNNICVKDILKILDTIEKKEIKEIKFNKKRKKSDIKNILDDNNYIKNFKNVTGKIWEFNRLLTDLD